MRRYRKGETFRPPTAAESAAHADAAESHRHAPAQPQDRAPIGQSILVKTPEDGIPGRDEDTIYWEKCKRCIERYTADEKEIVETDEDIIVYNLFSQGVPGDTRVATALTGCGTRYAILVGPAYFELKETLDADSTTGATAHPRDYDPSANGGEGGYTTDTDVDREFTVKDTREVGYEGSAGAKGACIMKTADNGAFGEIIDMECP